jgi:hypothetical protein
LVWFRPSAEANSAGIINVRRSPWAVENLSTRCFRRPRGPSYLCSASASRALPNKPDCGTRVAEEVQILLSKLDTGCGIKKGPGLRGRGLGSGQLSAVSGQLSVFSCQFLVVSFQFAETARRRSLPAYVHRSSFSLLPAPIASFFERSDAIEPIPETLAMTKTTIKQASSAFERPAGKVQLQR